MFTFVISHSYRFIFRVSILVFRELSGPGKTHAGRCNNVTQEAFAGRQVLSRLIFSIHFFPQNVLIGLKLLHSFYFDICYSKYMKLAPNISSFIHKHEMLNFKNQGVNFIKVLPVRTMIFFKCDLFLKYSLPSNNYIKRN